MSDVPAPDDQNRARMLAGHDSLIGEYMEDRPISIAQNQQPAKEVTDVGQIARLTLPDGFEKGPRESGTSGNNLFEEYHLGTDADVKLYFEYRGRRMSQTSSTAFKDLLAAPEHRLKPDELEALGELLGDKKNPGSFRVDVARTQDLNGKRVLVVEGRYLQHDLQARSMYIDTDGSGSAVQEVTFQTPADKVSKHFLAGVRALESVVWK
ncbi:MAG: hypothetical protein KC777_03170 [Cyanobacteria bacterium HKST-UBA02]|nr:hypothetical protein [Cyanobacteria bacterium HKST-UBA02]